jgi:hypothetical protein
MSAEGNSFTLAAKRHPGTETFAMADQMLVAKLWSNERARDWIMSVGPLGRRSFELRLMLAEAAHFVADAACALGRDTTHEILPVFLIGVQKLNDVLAHFDNDGLVSKPPFSRTV